MALEDQIVALTAALNRNSDLLDILTAKAKAGTAAPATSKPVEEAVKEVMKEVAKEVAKPAPKEEAAPAKRTRAAKAEKVKVPTEKEMAEATTSFLEVDDETEYNERRAFVKEVLAAMGAKKMSEIEEGKRQKALDALEAFKNGDDPELGEAEDDLA